MTLSTRPRADMKRSRRNRALPDWRWVLLRRGNNRRCRQRAGKVGRTHALPVAVLGKTQSRGRFRRHFVQDEQTGLLNGEASCRDLDTHSCWLCCRAVSLTSHGSLANGSQAQYQARSYARPMPSGLSTPPEPRSLGMARKGRRRGRKRGLGWLSAG